MTIYRLVTTGTIEEKIYHRFSVVVFSYHHNYCVVLSDKYLNNFLPIEYYVILVNEGCLKLMIFMICSHWDQVTLQGVKLVRCLLEQAQKLRYCQRAELKRNQRKIHSRCIYLPKARVIPVVVVAPVRAHLI